MPVQAVLAKLFALLCAGVAMQRGAAALGDITAVDWRHLQELAANQTDVEYQTIAPTPTSDRVCAPLSTCRPEEVEEKEPTLTSDRVCVNMTELPPVAPTACAADEYATAPNGKCTPLTRCHAANSTSTAKIGAPVGARTAVSRCAMSLVSYRACFDSSGAIGLL
jgi:hypothetical protein